MNFDLRAFLFLPDAGNGWRVSLYTNADVFASALRAVAAQPAACAVLHVGFWAPTDQEVASLAEAHPGVLIVSDAAAGALADKLPVEAAAVGCIRGVVFRRALKDWVTLGGWDAPDQAEHAAAASEPASNSPDRASAQVAQHVPSAWISNLATNGSDELAGVAAAAGVVDEDTYLALESGLPSGVRAELGVLRFISVAGDQVDAPSILDNLWACPPWLLALPLERLALTVRQANVFKARGLDRVGDLVPLGATGLLKLPNLGQGSVHALSKILVRALESGLGLPVDPSSKDARTSPYTEEQAAAGLDSLRSGFRAMAMMLNDVQREVWAGRLGFGCEPMTLAALGERVQLTREGVRQVEKQIYRKVERHPFWEQLATRIEAALDGRQAALMLEDLAAIDPWFEADLSLEGVLAGTLEQVLSPRLGVHLISGKLAVSRLLVHEWAEVRDAARDVLDAAVRDQAIEDDVRRECDQLLVGRGQELRVALWTEVTSRCVWAGRPGEPRHLVSLDDSIGSVLQAVLESADEPLHFTEIHRRAELIRPGCELRYVQNTVQGVGILYDRGTYGLPRHCPLDSAALAQVRTEVEDLMASGDAARQWHASELCDVLIDRGMGFDGRLTPYVINFALKDSKLLVDLRRMVWGLGAAWLEGAASRVDVRTAVIALLREHGSPMTTDEIRERLREVRGVSQTFQIHPSGPLVRVGTGLWGLVTGEEA
jgi:hypothetical protein